MSKHIVTVSYSYRESDEEEFTVTARRVENINDEMVREALLEAHPSLDSVGAELEIEEWSVNE